MIYQPFRAAVQASFITVLVLPLIGCGTANFPTPSPPGYTTVVFPNDNVQFDMPEKYVLFYEQDESISIRPSEDSGIVLQFSLNNLPEPIAEEFLVMQAKEKEIEVTRIGNKATISESGNLSEEGKNYEMTFWQIGFDDSLVVMSAKVDQAHKMDPDVIECLDGVPTMIESMHKF
ncbi:hypothetical protein [Blastopirellula marina]|uniref:DUF1795 domain-containing protein n=1 Tax=Blastopirellula marina TaxID=124 RepID=A0A2S8G1C7_9BACT|nr:hypothetical protein [Blastopirellula marina]PQO37934.1 hypothetical protein C5Y98_07510 [Blastopirellula marina]PTL44590.1 hypothetical protein C5Y97_07510 [Blastopirellula marina]